jgi:hypothetical protein
MKAAPEAAISAVRVIARKLLRRIDIAKALVIAPRSRITVNTALILRGPAFL